MQISRVTGSWLSISSMSKLAREGRQRLHTEYIMNRDHHAPIDDAGVFSKSQEQCSGDQLSARKLPKDLMHVS